MTVLVTGSSGLVGSALIPNLEAGGHRVFRLVRRSPQNDTERRWDPETGELDAADLEGVQAVVHLAGENIATGRWNDAKKDRIRSSREDGTRLLAQGLAELQTPPGVLICASAVGYYGNRGDEILDEESAPTSWRRRASTGSRPRDPRRTRASVRCTCASELCSAPTAARWPKCCSRSKWAQAA